MALLRLAIVANMLKIMSMETISFQKEAQSAHTHTYMHTHQKNAIYTLHFSRILALKHVGLLLCFLMVGLLSFGLPFVR